MRIEAVTTGQLQDLTSTSNQQEQDAVDESRSSGHRIEQGSDEAAASTFKSPSKSTDQKPKHRIPRTDQEISPPPLRRKLLNGNSIPVKESIQHEDTSKTQSTSIASTPSTPQTTRKISIKAPPKQEALNPRHLPTGAPAKHDFRFRLVAALYEQLTRLNTELAKDANDDEEKLVLSDQELITKALDIEENAAKYQSSIYSNVVKNQILVYKKMFVGQWKDERETELRKVKDAEASLLSNKPVLNPRAPTKSIETGLSTDEELQVLPRLYTPILGLSKHGYVITIPTDKDIETAQKGIEAAKGWEVCDRCKTRFQVFPERREEDGALTSGGSCTYHFGRPYWQERSAADPKAKREKRYRCCGQSMGDSSGCTQAESHVFKISEVKRMAAVLNFEKTPENQGKVANRPVCIDGEMGYTVFGLELIRLTATSWPKGDELFDVLVRPIGPVLDLNSRYSGVWPKDLAEALPWDSASESESESGTKRQLRIVESPAAARALLFSHISPTTPLIGHGLENDLNATRIIHPTVIDTALLFPHKAGLPYRNGLKTLMHTHLNRHIQVVVDGKMDGHDSKEDANAAGDLVRFALGNEWQKMKREGWFLKDAKVTAPPAREPPPGTPTGPSCRKRSRDEMEEVEEGEVDG
jgi:hypothetical protein